MVYQVGSPAMLDGKRFLPETGTPIWKIDLSRTMLAVWLPEPLTVATWMLKSLTRVCDAMAAGAASRSEEAMDYLPRVGLARDHATSVAGAQPGNHSTQARRPRRVVGQLTPSA